MPRYVVLYSSTELLAQYLHHLKIYTDTAKSSQGLGCNTYLSYCNHLYQYFSFLFVELFAIIAVKNMYNKLRYLSVIFYTLGISEFSQEYFETQRPPLTFFCQEDEWNFGSFIYIFVMIQIFIIFIISSINYFIINNLIITSFFICYYKINFGRLLRFLHGNLPSMILFSMLHFLFIFNSYNHPPSHQTK